MPEKLHAHRLTKFGAGAGGGGLRTEDLGVDECHKTLGRLTKRVDMIEKFRQALIVMKTKKAARKGSPSRSQNLLKQLARKPDKLFTGAFRVQYGALCFRQKGEGPEIEILVITSRETGRWVLPKGWPMKGKKPHQAAATEAWEEAGVSGRTNKTPVGRYVYLKELDDGDVAPVMVEMYQVEVTKVQADFKEKGQRVLAWVSPDEAARRVREVELKSMLVNFKPIAD